MSFFLGNLMSILDFFRLKKYGRMDFLSVYQQRKSKDNINFLKYRSDLNSKNFIRYHVANLSSRITQCSSLMEAFFSIKQSMQPYLLINLGEQVTDKKKKRHGYQPLINVQLENWSGKSDYLLILGTK